IAWSAKAGGGSYASPQLDTIAGIQQCLMLGEQGLHAFDPATGKELWHYGWEMPGAPRAVQSHVLNGTHVVAGTLTRPGGAMINVTPDGSGWKVDPVWESSQMKPEFPDFVVHDGHIYGFDGAIFCCLDATTGKRCWKEGRYGRGQVMLLPNQSLLLVVSETG